MMNSAKQWLGELGFDPSYGARPLKRTIQREVETPIAKAILGGKYPPGDTFYQCTLSMYPVNVPCQCILSMHPVIYPINTSYRHILTIHLINAPSSNHFINTLYQHILSISPLILISPFILTPLSS